MAYAIYKVESINNNVITGKYIYANPEMLLQLQSGVVNKFTFVKASSLDILNAPTESFNFDMSFNYKDKF